MMVPAALLIVVVVAFFLVLYFSFENRLSALEEKVRIATARKRADTTGSDDH